MPRIIVPTFANLAPMDIHLRRYWLPLQKQIGTALATFARQHPGAPICTVGLWGDGFNGAATLHLDTPDHSAAHIAKFPDAAREDTAGRFSASCRDFKYQIGAFYFSDYPDLYHHPPDVELAFVSLDGDRGIVDRSRGDAGKDAYVLPFLTRLISSFEPFPQLSRVWPLRVCVEMHGSGEVECWRLDAGEQRSQ